MDAFLQQLLSISAPSGYEEEVISLFKERIQAHVDMVDIDVLGNLVAQKFCKRQSNAETIIVAAHADEIGFVVKHIDDNGFVHVKNIGGVDSKYLPGKSIVFSTAHGAVHGVFGEKPIHMTLHSENQEKESVRISDLWVDIGCKDNESASKLLSVGDSATFTPGIQILNGALIASKALDNRISLYILYKVLEGIEDAGVNIIVAVTTQEEIGRRGAMALANAYNADKCIILDVAHATDYPTIDKNTYGDIRLGRGVVVPMGANISKSVHKELLSVANNCGIDVQSDVLPADSRTDAAVMQTVGTNRGVGIISVPVRYMHSSFEVGSLDDIQSAIKLLRNYLMKQ